MHRVPLPFTDAYLLLSPRWGELTPPAQISLLVLLCLVPTLLVLWLYRTEMLLVPRRVAAGLLLLRLTVLAVIVLLVGFQPIFARSHVEELPGRVLIAVDRSESMDVADPQRPLADKARLAAALRLAPDVVPDEELRQWAQKLDEGSDIARWPEADRARLAQLVKRVDNLTRAEASRRALTEDGANLLGAVTARHRAELLGFTHEAWDAPPGGVAELFAPRPGGAGFTDLRLPLVRALERSSSEGGKVLGVVLLTDGQHDWGPSPVKKAIELGEHQLPIFPVPLGARQPPPDVAVVGVKAPPAVFKDVDTTVEARVKVSGLRERRRITVQLQRPGSEPLQETITTDGTDRFYTVRFTTRLDRVGTQALTIAALPTPGETRPDNNQRTALVNVADDRAKVLLIDGEARWEHHYLASALQRDRTVQPQSVVFQQPRLERIPEEELRRSGNPWLTLPTEPDALAAYDGIVLGDVTPAQLPQADRLRLEKYVADRGGTLIIVAGKRAMPLAYTGADASSESEPLRRLLPIEAPRVLKPAAGFPVTLTFEGKSTAFLQMETEPDRNEARWAEFPRHFWGVVGRAKPGASVLAYVADEKPARPSGPEAERSQALIVRQNYGFGRVLYVGVDSTWRWRYRVGDTYHHRFWGQAVRWAASEKPLVTGNNYVRFGTRDAVYRHGQEVDLVVRLSEEAGPLAPDALAGARVLRLKEGGGEEAVALVPLGRREAQPRVLEGKLRDLPAGQYAVELAIPEMGDRLREAGKPLRATFRVAAPEGEELVELATNYPLLEELAAKSGGQVFAPEQVSGLVEALTKRAVRHEERIENPLWQWWVVLVLVLSLLTLEWVGRKWAGLP